MFFSIQFQTIFESQLSLLRGTHMMDVIEVEENLFAVTDAKVQALALSGMYQTWHSWMC